mmetsp:Transcript_9997/g.11361  ORF Transcript_9997/g.11361 Transcript_9997/m.11361 type:complete len:132 (-) Transcript_9997:70-465(-)
MKIDSKQNAMISKQELRDAFDKANLSITTKEIKSIIDEVNFSGDGHINYSSFCMATMKKTDLLNSKNTETLFNIFDSDLNGSINQNDIIRELRKIGDFSKANIKSVIKDSGIRKNTTLGIEEFRQILNSSE